MKGSANTIAKKIFVLNSILNHILVDSALGLYLKSTDGMGSKKITLRLYYNSIENT